MNPSSATETGSTGGSTDGPTTGTTVTPTTGTTDLPTTSGDPTGEVTGTTSTTTVDPTASTGADTTGTSGTTGTTGDTDTGDTDTGGPVDGTVVCDAPPLAPPAEGLCELVSQGPGGTLLRGTVLAPDVVYENGAVLVDPAGIIACVGCDCLDKVADATVVACEKGVISPGLINPHDHITFANNKPIGEGVDRYEHRHDWRKGKNGHQALNVPGGASKNVVLAAELRFLMSGATSAASAGGQAGLLRNLDSNPEYLEGLPLPLANSDTFPLGDSNGNQLAMGCNYPGVTLTSEIADENAYLPHIAEGIDNYARNEFVCLSQGMTDVIAQQTAIIHAIGLNAQDSATIHPDKARIIWSPRSNVVLYGNTAQATVLDILGVPLALGTDWVASGSMNLLRELRCADELNSKYYDNHFDDKDLWEMVTLNAALATGSEGMIGQLREGFAGDVAIFDGSQNTHHAAVVRGELPGVALVLRGGQPLYGDAAIVQGLSGVACEALDVCGTMKQACVMADTGVSLAAVKGAIDAIYPLFFCETPDLEPSCVPSRPNEYTGIAAADDIDGDNVKDADDNCPAVFNPPMKIDPNQLDFDGDAIGDACDVCPTDNTDTCMAVSADDMDDDGVPNGADNCIRVANGGQEDADGDGKGDTCDACPSANPGLAACPTTIEALRDPAHPDHAAVTKPNVVVQVEGAYVTGIRPAVGNSRGFHIETGTQAPYTGIFVFTGGSSPPVKIGDRVTVTGTYELYFGLHELALASLEITETGNALPFQPKAVPPASVATGGPDAEKLQSLLVQVDDVEITVQNSDAPMDFDEFSLTGNLRVDDGLSDAVKDMQLNNACAVATKFQAIAGVLSYSFNNSKLMPRIKADIVLGPNNNCNPWP
jgi:cytosine/adenosine deaminase-related metal-dependent hydrolase